MRVFDAYNDILKEYTDASCSHPPFHSAHEGFAVLKEEVDELWDEVKKNPKTRDPEALKKEAIQIAAMALRFLVDVVK
jgi:NTP pyrophosphatase (non-canonical NTP hydrolase)